MTSEEKFVTGPIALKAREGGGWELERFGKDVNSTKSV